jgi:hypothetical protein
MITAVGVPAIAWAPDDAAIIATITTMSAEGTPDAHRLTAPRLPGDRRRPFRAAPDHADLRLKPLIFGSSR